MRKKKSAASWTLFLFFLNHSIAQNADTNRREKIDSIVKTYMEANDIVGISIGIVRANEIYYTKGYGTTEIHISNPVDAITGFHTASISKLFTATAIMQLAEKGKLDIHKKLTDYIPEFSMKGEAYKTITVEQMLTHTSGIGNYTWKNKGADSLAIEHYALSLKNKKLTYAPGVTLSHKTYSNTAYSVLGYLVEKISGQPFDVYVHDNILKPAGMAHSGYFYKKIEKTHLSQPHIKNRWTKKVRKSNNYPEDPQGKPNANLISCSKDLCHWMLHNIAVYKDSTGIFNGILPHPVLQKMWTTAQAIPGKTTSVGLGWWIGDHREFGKYVFHVGNDPGFCATLMIFPEKDLGIVLLCNGRYPMEAVWNKMPFEIIQVLQE